MSWNFYDQWKLEQVNGSQVNFATAGDTLKIALVTATYVPDAVNDQFWSTPVANEVSGTNYTAGGITLANKTLGLASHIVTFSNTVNPSWAQSGAGFANARYAVLLKFTGVNSTSPVIAYADLGGAVGNTLGALTLQLDTAGAIWTLT